MSEPVGLLPGCPAELPGVLVADQADAQARGLPLVLGHHQQRLSLWRPGGRETPLAVDFCGGRQGYRLTPERVRHERLIRALGKPQSPSAAVLDATAGLGRDAALMAQAGFRVWLIERSPILHALLADGLSRGPDTLVAQMQLLPCGASGQQSLPPQDWHGIYLDPMFPARGKSAAVKKDLSWLQLLCAYPDAQEEGALLDWARLWQPRRVVVKRPVKAPPLAGCPPAHSQAGKTVRFDIYPREMR
ncbi:MAG: class I SAM-dependent methyltransferase [Alcanivorax sp.]|nr:class I SAM-dependent methyltransferase [Alcanivorax sp.]